MIKKPVRMIILSAPSGAGKSSFIDRILKELPVLFDTTTFTTRAMRTGETDGNPYYFVTKERFQELIRQGYFVEWAPVHENLYGTPLHQIETAFADKRVVIMDVDVKGADTFKKKFPDAASIFILPPSIEELKRRILSRDKKAPEDLETRLLNAKAEMAQSENFDFQLVNDDFEKSYLKFKKIIEELLDNRIA